MADLAESGLKIASEAIIIIEKLLNLPAEVHRRWLAAEEVTELVNQLKVAMQTSKDTLTTLRLRSEAESRARDEYAGFLTRQGAKLAKFRTPTLLRKTLSLIVPYYKWQMRLQRWKTRLEELQRNTNQLHPQQVLSCEQSLPQGRVVNHPARDKVAAALQARADSRVTNMPMVVQLSGLTGMGKTALAAGLALELEKKGAYNGGVYFISAAELADADAAGDKLKMALQRTLLHQLGWDEYGQGINTSMELKQQLEDLFVRELHSRNHLIVLDGAPDCDAVSALRCDHMKGTILVIAADSLYGDPVLEDLAGVQHVRLEAGPDSHKAAKILLKKIVKLKHDASELTTFKKARCRELLDVCNGNLQAVVLMGTALLACGNDRDGWTNTIATFSAVAGDDKVLGAIQTCANALTSKRALTESNMAGHLFTKLLPLLQLRQLFPFELVKLLVQVISLPEILPQTAAPALLGRLCNASLLCQTSFKDKIPIMGVNPDDPNADVRYFAPGLVNHYLSGLASDEIFAQLPAAPDGNLHQKCNKLAVLLLGYGRPPAVQWALQRLQLALQLQPPLQLAGPLPVGHMLLSLARCPETDFSDGSYTLCLHLGEVLFCGGQYAAANALIQKCLQALEESDNKTAQLARAQAMVALARLQYEQEQLQGAKQTISTALELYKAAGLQPPSRDVRRAQQTLAVILSKLQQFAEAELEFRAVKALCQQELGPADEATILSLNNLGYCLTLAPDQKLGEAAHLLGEALQMARQHLAPYHPERQHWVTAMILDSMALLREQRGDNVLALQYYDLALAMKEATQGPNHPSTIATRQRRDALRDVEIVSRHV